MNVGLRVIGDASQELTEERADASLTRKRRGEPFIEIAHDAREQRARHVCAHEPSSARVAVDGDLERL